MPRRCGGPRTSFEVRKHRPDHPIAKPFPTRELSHGICPACYQSIVKSQVDSPRADKR